MQNKPNFRRSFSLLFLFLLICSTIVCSQPPITVVSGIDVLDVRLAIPDNLMINQEFRFHAHLFTGYNGLPLMTPDIVNCTLHIYNSSGSHIFLNTTNSFEEDDIDIEFIIPGTNFTKPEDYPFILQCNCVACGSSAQDIGGFSASFFEVFENTSNERPTESEVNQISDVNFFTLIIFGMFFLIGLILILFMHEFKEEKVSIAYGFFALTIFVLLSSMAFFGLEIIDTNLVPNLPFNINILIGTVCLLIALYSGWISVALWQFFSKEDRKRITLDEEFRKVS